MVSEKVGMYFFKPHDAHSKVYIRWIFVQQHCLSCQEEAESLLEKLQTPSQQIRSCYVNVVERKVDIMYCHTILEHKFLECKQFLECFCVW